MPIIYIIISVFIITMGIAGKSLAPWIPARKKDLLRIFNLAQLQPEEVFYDLGCGDGRLVIYAGQNFKAIAIGLELALPFFLFCKIRQLSTSPREKIFFKYKNLFTENLSSADVIYVFGIPKKIQSKLRQKIEQEIKPGARVISYAFPFTDWTPKTISKPTDQDLPIFLYQF